jgi:glycine betaine/proline transport system ATP-binding protein
MDGNPHPGRKADAMQVRHMPGEARPVKLACRNLWKIYGPRAADFVASGRLAAADNAELRSELQQLGHLAAVIDASFEVHVGEIFVIMGLSGSGKSTIVRCLSRLVEPTAGHVLLDGVDLLQASARQLIELRRHAMGMVFQNFGLLPHLTVLDNVAFPLRVQGKAAAERQARAREMIALVGLEGREGAYPNQLSGGQQQRVGIARSLAVGPGLWFLDEPFSALDPLIRRQMQDEFLRLQRLLHKTIVFITHDIVEAFRLADRIAIMREGEIIQIGRPVDIVLKPADDYVAAFTEDVPLLRVISAGDIMEPAAPEPVVDGRAPSTIAPDTSLESLVPLLAAGTLTFAVVGADGRPLGTVQAAAALALLARDRERRRPA